MQQVKKGEWVGREYFIQSGQARSLQDGDVTDEEDVLISPLLSVPRAIVLTYSARASPG